MPSASVADSTSQLRRDLHTIQVDGRRRPYRIVVDEISGRFTRVSEHVWQSLVRGIEDPNLWAEARAAGWTRERLAGGQRRFSPMYFRIPIGSIDRLAVLAAPLTRVLFSAAAVMAWCVVIVVAAVIATSRSDELFASLGSLQIFFEQSSPIWLGAWFVATKVAHELAHAVICRRMGSRCGTVGILMLCGVPCPYCDVTDIWREPSAIRRAAVMMAGIYVELIIASIATFVWITVTDPVIRLHALNLMIVCSISTILFNANPLMRYDGYYVLADLVGSTNLRREARDAFRSVVTARLAGRRFDGRRSNDYRSLALAFYHLASSLYRFVITIAIATLLLVIAEWFQLRPVMMTIIALAVVVWFTRNARRLIGVAGGANRWSGVSRFRRATVLAAMLVAIFALLFVPLPRYRQATGEVNAASATSVFLANDGMIEHVSRDFGDRVVEDQSLVNLRNPLLALQQAKLEGQLRVAKLSGNLARRASLDQSHTAHEWRSMQATEDAIAAQLASVHNRVSQTDVRAPVSGVVLPPQTSIQDDPTVPTSLRDQIGTFGNAHSAWCRISSDGALHAVLIIDARDRAKIKIGTPVNISLREAPEQVFSSTVISVSAIQQDEPSVTRQAAYQVLCPLPAVDERSILAWLGKECKGVFHLPNRMLAADAKDWIVEWLGG